MSLTNEDKQWIDARFEKIERTTISQLPEISGKIERIEAKIERTEAKIERTETALLTEFHKWASPAELRARSHAAAIRALDIEFEALTDRVEKPEPLQ